jgi:hypothetical protein
MRTKKSQIFFLFSSLFFFTFLLKGEILAQQNACPTTTGSTLTITQSCAFTASVDGVDNGTLIIQAANPPISLTLNANQTIVYGTLQKNNATIIINKNGSALKKGYLYYQIQTPGVKDADEDGFMYPSTSTLSTTKYYSFTPTLGASGYVRVSLASTTKADCYDQNAEARPGQTEYFTVHRGDGSFDYNCNGQEEKQYPSVTTERCRSICSNFTPGWETSVPSCGASDYWLPGTCDLSTDVCIPITQWLTQACR